MNIPTLKLGQAVQIDWEDSKSAMGWVYNSLRERVPGEISSLGYVVQVNPRCVTITTSLDKQGASIDELSIPLGCIKQLETLPGDWDFGGPKED